VKGSKADFVWGYQRALRARRRKEGVILMETKSSLVEG